MQAGASCSLMVDKPFSDILRCASSSCEKVPPWSLCSYKKVPDLKKTAMEALHANMGKAAICFMGRGSRNEIRTPLHVSKMAKEGGGIHMLHSV